MHSGAFWRQFFQDPPQHMSDFIVCPHPHFVLLVFYLHLLDEPPIFAEFQEITKIIKLFEILHPLYLH